MSLSKELNNITKLETEVLETFKIDYDKTLIKMILAQIKEEKKLLLKHNYRLTDNFKKVIKKNLEILNSEYISPEPQENEAIFEGSSAQAFSKNLAEQLSYEVENIRERIFNNPKPLFKSVRKAVIWIREQQKLEPDDRLVTVVVDRETTNDLHTPLEPATPDNPKSIKVLGVRKLYHKDSISFHGTDTKSNNKLVDTVNSLPISSHGANHWSTKLAKLAHYAKKLADFTGWQEQQATMFILTGLTPLLPPARITIHNKSHRIVKGGDKILKETLIALKDKLKHSDEQLDDEELNKKVWKNVWKEADHDWISYQYATVSFFGFYMTKKELIKLHARLREMVGLKHKKKLESEQKELVDFVRDEIKNLKYSNAGEAWDKLAGKWAALKGSKLTKGNSFYNRYTDICTKLNTEPIRPKRKKRGKNSRQKKGRTSQQPANKG